MALARRTKRIVAAVLGALVALTLVGLGFVGNFLVDFALNPHAEVSMARSMGSGRVSGLEGSREAKADDAYAETAAAWFDATRESVSHQAEDGTVLLGWRLDGAEDAAYSDGHTWAVVCHGYVGEPAGTGDLSGFADADTVSGWAEEAMSWSVGAGLIQGDENGLTPTATAIRAQIAAILMRFCENVAK